MRPPASESGWRSTLIPNTLDESYRRHFLPGVITGGSEIELGIVFNLTIRCLSTIVYVNFGAHRRQQDTRHGDRDVRVGGPGSTGTGCPSKVTCGFVPKPAPAIVRTSPAPSIVMFRMTGRPGACASPTPEEPSATHTDTASPSKRRSPATRRGDDDTMTTNGPVITQLLWVVVRQNGIALRATIDRLRVEKHSQVAKPTLAAGVRLRANAFRRDSPRSMRRFAGCQAEARHKRASAFAQGAMA